MTIHITDPGWDWTPLVWGGVILLIFAIPILLIGLASRELWAAAAVLTCTAVSIGIIVFFAMIDTYGARVHDAKVAALEGRGFTSVTLNEDESFTANRDGVYFRGSLIGDDDHSWSVAEVHH